MLYALQHHSGQIWEVDSDNDDGEYRRPPHYILALFVGEPTLDNLAGTEPVQIRTLLALRRCGLIEMEIP